MRRIERRQCKPMPPDLASATDDDTGGPELRARCKSPNRLSRPFDSAQDDLKDSNLQTVMVRGVEPCSSFRGFFNRPLRSGSMCAAALRLDRSIQDRLTSVLRTRTTHHDVAPGELSRAERQTHGKAATPALGYAVRRPLPAGTHLINRERPRKSIRGLGVSCPGLCRG